LAEARDLILNGRAQARPADEMVPPPANLAGLLALIAAAKLDPVFAVPLGVDGEAGMACIRTVLARAQAFSIIR
jgi:hypothetical protein